MTGGQNEFPITFVCRDDIPEAFGFPRYRGRAKELADKLTDAEMKELAAYIGEMCCANNTFWQSINEWMVERYGKELEGE